ncbi:uncharacterized protein LOC131612410 [Vicia villosa]|uniref:uncharacterized protein LOC131612410 n=1 Tax=Vicia villosa TaxID=3911 RepID=UPI00273ABB5D|nr:uncharacterized protein LOC131612410 [Vicia villosa]
MISSKNESIDEIKNQLLSTRLELISSKMEANAEIKKYEETVKQLYKLLKSVCQERDEARNQVQLLIRKFQPSVQIDHPMEPSCDLSLSSPQSNEKKISSIGSSNTRIVESRINHQKNHTTLCNNSYDTESVNPNEFVLTSLSLAFPENSNGPSKMSHGSGSSSGPGSGFLVKNEPMLYMDSNGMQNHTISRKKRKFL